MSTPSLQKQSTGIGPKFVILSAGVIGSPQLLLQPRGL